MLSTHLSLLSSPTQWVKSRFDRAYLPPLVHLLPICSYLLVGLDSVNFRLYNIAPPSLFSASWMTSFGGELLGSQDDDRPLQLQKLNSKAHIQENLIFAVVQFEFGNLGENVSMKKFGKDFFHFCVLSQLRVCIFILYGFIVYSYDLAYKVRLCIFKSCRIIFVHEIQMKRST